MNSHFQGERKIGWKRLDIQCSVCSAHNEEDLVHINVRRDYDLRYFFSTKAQRLEISSLVYALII